MAANSYASFSFKPPTVSGYKPVGIVGYKNPISASLLLFGFSASSIDVRNIYNLAFSGTITMTVLYAK